MRTSDRIRPMLTEIENLWVNHPDLRFGQLIKIIANTSAADPELFYMEDQAFLTNIELAAQKMGKEKE